jgi:hypothetical protein
LRLGWNNIIPTQFEDSIVRWSAVVYVFSRRLLSISKWIHEAELASKDVSNGRCIRNISYFMADQDGNNKGTFTQQEFHLAVCVSSLLKASQVLVFSRLLKTPPNPTDNYS